MQIKKPRRTEAVATSNELFIAETYKYLTISLIGMLLFGALSYNKIGAEYFTALAIADAILWILCGWFGWRNPIQFIFPIFTMVTGLFLGSLALKYTASGMGDIFLNAALLTIVIFLGLSAYVYKTRNNFRGLSVFLYIQFWTLIVGFILYFITQSNILHFGLSIFGAIAFIAWILFDSGRIMDQWDKEIPPSIGAFELFLDIIGLFSYLRSILKHVND